MPYCMPNAARCTAQHASTQQGTCRVRAPSPPPATQCAHAPRARCCGPPSRERGARKRRVPIAAGSPSGVIHVHALHVRSANTANTVAKPTEHPNDYRTDRDKSSR
eukprot:8894-Chlamydomonas_euryale.AAC.4